MTPPTIRFVPTEPIVRPARAEDRDAVAAILYLSAAGAYDIYAGGRGRAMRLLAAAFDRGGTDASREVVTVAELDGRVAAAMASFAVIEGHNRAMSFLRLSILRTPPWRWPRTLRIFRQGASVTPIPPPTALYIDSLATDPAMRRRGAASALLREAERSARERGLSHVALDTVAGNAEARALYESNGFEATEERPGKGVIPAIVGLVKPVGPRAGA